VIKHATHRITNLLSRTTSWRLGISELHCDKSFKPLLNRNGLDRPAQTERGFRPLAAAEFRSLWHQKTSTEEWRELPPPRHPVMRGKYCSEQVSDAESADRSNASGHEAIRRMSALKIILA
jgi:hypothetical protein